MSDVVVDEQTNPKSSRALLAARDRREAIRCLDVLALELLLQSAEHRGLMQGTPFASELPRAARGASNPAARFERLFRLLERIDTAGLLTGTELHASWRAIRAARGERVAPREAHDDGLRPLERRKEH